MKFVCYLLVAGIFGLQSCVACEETGKAIQIVVPVNHAFQLQTNELKPILENENIKDRQVVVVSIAGALRQGKSFLLNFFLKYLYAQYKAHDVTDWIGETANNTELSGFKWRSGQKVETLGIWMWSEVFTHDFETGEKVAIILLDTQGIADGKSSVEECTTIGALSMMLSSVQCVNVKDSIKEDDLQHLELFTEYGRLASEQTKEKAFQKLLYIVRDWVSANETEYGWNGQDVIDGTLAANETQTPEMRQLRERIEANFEKITAFLMPSPGTAVVQGDGFTGNLQQIDPAFITYVKELVPQVLAPESMLLVVKRINGQVVKAQDFLQYLETYVKKFNGESMPIPKEMLMATAEASNLISHNECTKLYVDSMQQAMVAGLPYLNENELRKMHHKAKSDAVAKFLEKPQMGGAELAASFQRKIETDAEEKYLVFKLDNDGKRTIFIEQANFHNANRSREIYESTKAKIIEELDHPNSTLSYSHLSGVFSTVRNDAFDEFNATKMGDDDISNRFLVQLEQDFSEFQSLMSTTLETYHLCLQQYSDKMQTSLNGVEYFETLDFTKLHQSLKSEAVEQFRSKPGDYGLKFKIEPKITQAIDEKLPVYEKQNEEKRQHFEKKKNFQIEKTSNEVFEKVKNRILEEINQPESSLTYSHLSTVFSTAKQAAIDELAGAQFGGEEMLNSFRNLLSLSLEAHQLCLQFYNDKMLESLNGVEYFSPFDFTKLHQSVKDEAISQFRSTPGDFGLKYNMQWRVEKIIDGKFPALEKQNEEKRRNFVEKSNWYTQTVRKEVPAIEAVTPAPEPPQLEAVEPVAPPPAEPAAPPPAEPAAPPPAEPAAPPPA